MLMCRRLSLQRDIAAADAAADAALNRTITFSHVDTDGDGNADTLTRRVDGGNISYLARGISDLTFTIQEDGDGDVSKVIVESGWRIDWPWR